jgi:hypothetical protein
MSNFIRVRVADGGVPQRVTPAGWARMGEGVPYAEEQMEGSVVVRRGPRGWLAERLRPGGAPAYSLEVEPGGAVYRLGPRFGYRVKRPEDESDPVLRLAREIGIPATKVVPVPDNLLLLPLSEGFNVLTDGRVLPPGGSVALADGSVELQLPDVVASDFTYVVETFGKELRSGLRGRFVHRLACRPSASPSRLAEALGTLGLAHRPEWYIAE